MEKRDIWYYEDIANESWYKMKGIDEDKQILVISKMDDKVRPLSYYSSIVDNMDEIKQIRIYVKPENREKAEEVIK